MDSDEGYSADRSTSTSSSLSLPSCDVTSNSNETPKPPNHSLEHNGRPIIGLTIDISRSNQNSKSKSKSTPPAMESYDSDHRRKTRKRKSSKNATNIRKRVVMDGKCPKTNDKSSRNHQRHGTVLCQSESQSNNSISSYKWMDGLHACLAPNPIHPDIDFSSTKLIRTSSTTIVSSPSPSRSHSPSLSHPPQASSNEVKSASATKECASVSATSTNIDPTQYILNSLPQRYKSKTTQINPAAAATAATAAAEENVAVTTTSVQITNRSAFASSSSSTTFSDRSSISSSKDDNNINNTHNDRPSPLVVKYVNRYATLDDAIELTRVPRLVLYISSSSSTSSSSQPSYRIIHMNAAFIKLFEHEQQHPNIETQTTTDTATASSAAKTKSTMTGISSSFQKDEWAPIHDTIVKVLPRYLTSNFGSTKYEMNRQSIFTCCPVQVTDLHPRQTLPAPTTTPTIHGDTSDVVKKFTTNTKVSTTAINSSIRVPKLLIDDDDDINDDSNNHSQVRYHAVVPPQYYLIEFSGSNDDETSEQMSINGGTLTSTTTTPSADATSTENTHKNTINNKTHNNKSRSFPLPGHYSSQAIG